MKITKLFLLGIAALLFSCSDDEAPLPTADGMIGVWNVTAVDYSGTSTTTFEGQTMKATFTGKGKEMDYTTTFSSSPNTVVSQGSYVIELKTTMAGQTTTEDYEFEDAFVDGNWELDGRTLTVTNGSETQEATITKQTATNLEVRVDIDQTETDPDLGYTITQKVKAVYKLERANP
ncbi:MAG TPA: hypothetical protein VGK59_02125 [Ohtaekwangia sp.]